MPAARKSAKPRRRRYMTTMAANAACGQIPGELFALPPLQKDGTRLLARRDVLAYTSVSFPSLWAWMREGKLPPAS